ncbi:MAG TPA: hypothetical protein VF613_12710 [Longimicrobium sp.]
MIVGVAAHITAAASGGPRYDPSLSAAERGGADNGMWLCETCGTLVDRDPERFTVDLLRKWKERAEAETGSLLGVPMGWRAIPGPELLSLSRMPVTRRELFGRADALGRLEDAWNDPAAHVLVFAAGGGVGKTALINRWLANLAAERYNGATRVFAWSFYSQGTHDQDAPADPFMEAALRAFGDPHPTQGSPWERGERLARLVRAERTLLVLDGLEPLQYGPGPQEGRLKERAIGTLLLNLAADNPGLCIVTSRLPVADLMHFDPSTVHHMELDTLDPGAGAELLLSLGIVANDPADLEDASRAFGGHALALTLLGNYLTDVCEADARRWREVGPLLDEPRAGGHARRVLRAYRKWFEGRPELSVLRLLGLFDRPAHADILRALREPPLIAGLTDTLPEGTRPWNAALAVLRRATLVSEQSPADPHEVDAHPLVREYFGEEVRRTNPDAWRAGHERLYRYLTTTTPEFPETLVTMDPLYAAVRHGREGGFAEEAIRDVYERRIQRGEQFFAFRTLGSVALDLACLSGFFVSPWDRLISGLAEDIQVRLFNRAGFYLRAIGRLSEAVQATEAATALRAERGEWKDAVLNAINLSELNVLMGELPRAHVNAERSVTFADQSSDGLAGVVSRAGLGYVAHQLGSFQQALELFAEAEHREAARGHGFHILYSLRGCQYCDLLLDQRRIEEVEDRARTILGWAEERKILLDRGLCHMILARAAHLRGGVDEALSWSHSALDLLQQADSLHHVARAFITRAQVQRAVGAYDDSEHSLTLARQQAGRAGLKLLLTDCDLESVWLRYAQDRIDAAREFLSDSSRAVTRWSYGRREVEVGTLRELLR